MVPGAANVGGSAPRLRAAIEHFRTTYDVHAILPTWAWRGPRALSEVDVLAPFLDHQVHLSPAGTNDDEFILRYALSKDAKVLTNDLLRDHISVDLVGRDWVDDHRIAFMFVGNEFVPNTPGANSHLTDVSV